MTDIEHGGPRTAAARTPRLVEDGVEYRDLNGNGRMDPYEDPRLSPAERADDLVPRLSLEEKVGLLFHTVIGVGDLDKPEGISPLSARDAVTGTLLNHFNLHALPSAAETVRWQNAMQELAETTPHGIPITFSSDPRHGFTENSGVSFAASTVSQWPEALGLAAIGDPEVMRHFADVVRREYAALGIRAALHPQIDLATEPRWGRQAQTFGQDAATTSALVVAFLQGLQGDDLADDGVAATTKHFPGGGPQRDGEDPHFAYGREQVYPGGRFDTHLEPFKAAIAAGTSAIMPYYGMPVGLEIDGEPVEQVGFSFNKRIVTGLLREQLGYDGVVVTDWGLVTDATVFGKPFPARAWGVENLPEIDRMAKILDAGADQFGGEDRVDLVFELVGSGRITEARIDEAVRRLLIVKFELGLFDDPYRDEETATAVVGCDEFRRAGLVAQSESVTVLKNGSTVLPLETGARVYLEGLRADAAAGMTVVDEPARADVAIVRLDAPFEPRDTYFLESFFRQGSLDFPADVVEHIRGLAAQVPVVLDVRLDRPAILTPLEPLVSGLVVTFGTSDEALVSALTGAVSPRGRLPFDLPSSMTAVEAARPDVPGDTADPLYRFGDGLSI